MWLYVKLFLVTAPAFGLPVALLQGETESLGEKVALELSPEGDGGTRVHVTSKPSVPITMADYGKNQANVNDVAAWLRGGPAAAAS